MPETKNDYKADNNDNKTTNLQSSIPQPNLNSQDWAFIESTESNENNEENDSICDYDYLFNIGELIMRDHAAFFGAFNKVSGL